MRHGRPPGVSLEIVQAVQGLGAEEGDGIIGSEAYLHDIVLLEFRRKCRDLGVRAAKEGNLPVPAGSRWEALEELVKGSSLAVYSDTTMAMSVTVPSPTVRNASYPAETALSQRSSTFRRPFDSFSTAAKNTSLMNRIRMPPSGSCSEYLRIFCANAAVGSRSAASSSARGFPARSMGFLGQSQKILISTRTGRGRNPRDLSAV